MTGASIETTLELWTSSLRDVKARMRSLFTQERVMVSVELLRRLRTLEILGLAGQIGPAQWFIKEEAEKVLRELGERGSASYTNSPGF